MKRLWWHIGLLISFVSLGKVCQAMESRTVEGSGVVITEKRAVKPFSSLDLNGSFTADIALDKEQRVEIKGDDNILPVILTEVRDGRLYVYSTKSYSTKTTLKITITVPVLKGVAVSGANEVSIRKVNNGSLALEAGGASTFHVSGKTGTLKAQLSGGSTLKADELKAEQVTVDVSGAGNADVYAVKKLDVTVMGVGNVVYKGNPEVSRQIMGVGSVSPK